MYSKMVWKFKHFKTKLVMPHLSNDKINMILSCSSGNLYVVDNQLLEIMYYKFHYVSEVKCGVCTCRLVNNIRVPPGDVEIRE